MSRHVQREPVGDERPLRDLSGAEMLALVLSTRPFFGGREQPENLDRIERRIDYPDRKRRDRLNPIR